MVRRSFRPEINLNKRPNLGKPERPNLGKPDGGGFSGKPERRPNNPFPNFPVPQFEDPLENHQPIFPGSPIEIGGGEGDIEDFLTTTPIGYEVEIVQSACEYGLRFTPVLVFSRLPPIEIIYRIPGCREPEPIKPLPPLNLPDVPIPPEWPGDKPPDGMFVEVVLGSSVDCIHEWWPESKLASLTGAFRMPDVIAWDGQIKNVDAGWGWWRYGRTRLGMWQYLSAGPVILDYGDSITNYTRYPHVGNSDFIQRFDPTSDRLLWVQWRVHNHKQSEGKLPYVVSRKSQWRTSNRLGTNEGRGNSWRFNISVGATSSQFTTYPSIDQSVTYKATNTMHFRGLAGELHEYLTSTTPVTIQAVYSGLALFPYSEGIGCHPVPPKIQPPPPPPPMSKCPCQDNDRLLKDILARVQKIEQTVGAPLFFDDKAKQLTKDKLPFAPERLIYPKARGDRKKHPLKNLVEVLEFQIRQMDRAVGDLPITIKIKDGDPSKEGDQKIEAEFHSLGSALKEIAELSIESGGDVDLQTLMLCRILYECGFIHQGSIQSQFILEAIADWLDFPVKYKTQKFPFAFNPRVGIELGKGFGSGQDQGDVPDTEAEFEKIAPRLLKETDTPIKVMELNPKQKTTQKDAIDEIQRLIRVCAAAAGEEATPENLDNLINVARLALRMDGLLQRQNIRQAMTQGGKPERPGDDILR